MRTKFSKKLLGLNGIPELVTNSIRLTSNMVDSADNDY